MREFFLECFEHFTGNPEDRRNWLEATAENNRFVWINWRYEVVLFHHNGWFSLHRPHSQFDSPIRRWVKEACSGTSFDFYDEPTSAGSGIYNGRIYDAEEVLYTIQCMLKVLKDRAAELPNWYLTENETLGWVWPPLKIDPKKDKNLVGVEIKEMTCYEACKPSLDLLLQCCQQAKEWKQPIRQWVD